MHYPTEAGHVLISHCAYLKHSCVRNTVHMSGRLGQCANNACVFLYSIQDLNMKGRKSEVLDRKLDSRKGCEINKYIDIYITK